jgi:hypothetical protein
MSVEKQNFIVPKIRDRMSRLIKSKEDSTPNKIILLRKKESKFIY